MRLCENWPAAEPPQASTGANPRAVLRRTAPGRLSAGEPERSWRLTVDYLILGSTAILGALIANGLNWSTARRRVSLIRELAETLKTLQATHPAHERLSKELDRQSRALAEHSDRAGRRFLATTFLGGLLLGYALLSAAQAYNHFVLDRPVEHADRYLDQVGLASSITGLGCIAVAILAAIMLGYINTRSGWHNFRSWRQRRRTVTDQQNSQPETNPEIAPPTVTQGGDRDTVVPDHD